MAAEFGGASNRRGCATGNDLASGDLNGAGAAVERASAAPLGVTTWLRLLTGGGKMTERRPNKERAQRARRTENGMAVTAGVSKTAPREKFSRSVALLRAALEVWEAKHGVQTNSVWKRRSQCEGS